MAKASMAQLQELGLRIRRGQIPEWKIPAVFGIVEADTLGTYLRLVDAARRELISAEQVQALMEDKDEVLGIFKVTVGYSQTLAQMASHYSTNGDINEWGSLISKGNKVESELILVCLDKVAKTDEAFAELDRRGLRPAKIRDLLVLGTLRPELQDGLPIVAGGSYWDDPDGERYFACLKGDEDAGEWFLDLLWVGVEWNGPCRFLAVRKDAA